jgi:6-phosphogluconolactonase
MNEALLYVGTYTMPILFGTGEILEGKGKGIHRYRMDSSTGMLSEDGLVARIDNPSFLAVNEQRTKLYAVNELKEFGGEKSGAVSSFAVDKNTGALTFLNQKPTGGEDPCHVCLDQDDKYLLISNFMTGSVCVLGINEDGSIGKRTAFVQHMGSSVNKARQAGPHAHSVTFSPDSSRLYVPDLGTDMLMTYDLDSGTGRLEAQSADNYVCEPGSGPRYCEFHPRLPICYMVNEISSQVTALRREPDSGRMVTLQTISTLPEGFAGENTCADLHITPDGRYLFASNRGHNSLARFAVDRMTGKLSLLGHTDSGGRTPRHFTFSPQGHFLLVGNQDSDCIAVLALNSDTGDLELVQIVDTPTPVCLCFV